MSNIVKYFYAFYIYIYIIYITFFARAIEKIYLSPYLVLFDGVRIK